MTHVDDADRISKIKNECVLDSLDVFHCEDAVFDVSDCLEVG